MKKTARSSRPGSFGARAGAARHERAERNPGATEAQSELEPGLYVTATPIGHARDITLRALDVLKACDVIAAEDTRVTAKLLAIHGIARPLMAYNDHNGARERPRILARLRDGECVALVSDAGTPLVSDPGYKLVREALAEGFHVEAIPGASALLAALVLSGLPADRFLFAGFLPAREGERRSVLTELKPVRTTLVFFESPHRLGECLAEMSEVLGPRPVAVGRELTKFHQEMRRGELSDIAAAYANEPEPRGEVTIVVGPPAETIPDTTRMDLLLSRTVGFMPVRAAAGLAAEVLGVSRHVAYERALRFKTAQDAQE